MGNGTFTIVHYAADAWEHVCPRVRVVAPLERAGLRHVRGNDWKAGQLGVFPERVADADLVIIQRDFPRYAAEYESVIARARALGKPVVYELDDLLTELPSQHPDAKFYGKARAAILQAAVEADAVTGSTLPLCDYLREFNPNAWLLPNYLDDQLWSLVAPESQEAPDDRPVTIGYLGSHAHLPDLEMVVPALARVLERYGARVALKFWGITPPALLAEHPQVIWSIPGLVSYAEFAAFFAKQECDVFIAPLQDNLFNRCKSPLKFLEYSARGIPGVYSRIAPYASVIEHGQNGFLAATPEEWEDNLSQLIESPELRLRLGLAAQQTVREQWLLSQHAGRWTDTYRQICDVRHASQSNVAARVARQMRAWHNELAEKSDSLGAQLAEQEQATQSLNAQLAEREQAMQALSGQLAEREQAMQALSVQLAEREQAMQALSGQLAEREQAMQALSGQLAEREQATQSLRTELVAIKSSKGWGLLLVLWRLRLVVAPRGSWRERVLRLGMRGLRVWGREGFLTFVRRGARIVVKHMRKNAGAAGDLAQSGPSLQFVAEAGTNCPAPAISVVIVKDASIPEIDMRAVMEWITMQTYRTVEVVIWHKESKTAWAVGAPASQWEAWDVESLCQGLGGRYVCIASSDLLQQLPTYLEANLIALETESLAFTVNACGNADWLIKRIEAGQLPGNSTCPLLHQVVRRDCLRNDYLLDLSARLAAQNKTPVVIGKIITHTTNRADAADALPFEVAIDSADILVLDHRIVARLDRASPWGAIPHGLHPVDSVLTIAPEPSPLPTVLVVMPVLAVGGAERVHLDVMRRLKDQFRFVMITLEPFDASLGTMADAFREVTPYIYSVPDYLAMPLNFSIMSYLIERFQPRTLYIANGATWIYDALCALKSCFPHLRMVNQVYDHQAGWINRYEPALAACLDAHIAVNRKICDAYVARGADPHRVHQIFNGVDEIEFDPACYSQAQRQQIAEKLGLPEGRKIITFIGRMHPQKRPMDFVELARRFSADSSLLFLMVGDGPLGEAVERETTRIGLKSLVRHSFYRPSSDVFAISDVVVMPSEYEGMPMVILEAQAMGTPVVATDVGNNREVLELTQGGVIVPRVGDVTALSEGLSQVLRMSIDPVQVRAATLTHFAMPKMVEAYRRILSGEMDA